MLLIIEKLIQAFHLPCVVCGQSFVVGVFSITFCSYFPPPQRSYLVVCAEILELALEDQVYAYEPPIPKDWVDLGSSVEIAEESVEDSRPKVILLV